MRGLCSFGSVTAACPQCTLRQAASLRALHSQEERRGVRACFFNQFNKGRKEEAPDDGLPKEIDITKLNLGDNPDSLVITELQTDAGTPGRIVYRCGGTVQLKQLERLCDRVGWPPRPIDKVKGALSNSYLVCSLTLEEAAENGNEPDTKLVGLARATSDHAFNATIWDVLIDPDFQGQGLGKALVEQMVKRLLRQGIGNITLFADAHVVPFYQRMGFEADPEGIKGMFWYPKS